MEEKNLECGRCGRPLDPTKLHALSRKDNKTTICSDCGTHEAITEYMKAGK